MLNFIRDCKTDSAYRDGFFALAMEVFGIDFAPWHARGYWNDRYVCYSYFDGSIAVANVSVNMMNLVICGKPRPAFQIGTVMTRPGYTGRGLAKDLMSKVLADCDKAQDLVYLLANKEVVSFYPKFGFTPAPQYAYSYMLDKPVTSAGAGRFLNVLDKTDTDLLLGLNARRSPVSNVFGVLEAGHILMFYACHGFDKHFYLVDTMDTVVVYRQEADTINLYDVIAPHMPCLTDVLKMIPLQRAIKIIFYFTPDRMCANAGATHSNGDDILFVRPGGAFPSRDFLHPALAQA